MTELHPTSGHQGMTEPFPKTRLVIETAERLSIEQTSDSAPLLDRCVHRNWDMFVIDLNESAVTFQDECFKVFV
jgi:hypothetical protein